MNSTAARAIDAVLDATVIGGYSRIGPSVRRRIWAWGPLPRLDGKVVAVTGATSGLGRATVEGAAALGADVILLVRDEPRGSALAEVLRDRYRVEASVFGVDLSDLASVAGAASAVAGRGPLDALVHNAGSLVATRELTSAGNELTFATHVLGPYLLTSLLLPTLEKAPDPRVIVVTSGGMYTQPLDVEALAHGSERYVGSVAYARCKRAQVSLVDLHRSNLATRGVTLAAFHPGWADTEGVRRSLPRFHSLLRPLLRSPEEGAETALWLIGAGREVVGTASMFCDRAARPLHRLPSTARSDSHAARMRLDQLVRARCGLSGTCS